MKFVSTLLGFVVVVCCTEALAARGRPVLNSARTTFVADNGRLLRGPFTSTEWTNAVPYSEVAAMKNFGFNAVHLYAEVFDPDYPAAGSRAPGYAAAEIDKIVQYTRDLGLYLVMTIGNGANNGDHNYDYAIDFWEFYAPRYKNETHVIYELHNEPLAWGPSYLTGTTPVNTMDMVVDAYTTARTLAPETPVLLFTYAVFGGTSGANAALTDIHYFNQQVFGTQDATWLNEAVGFHGYGGWEGTSEAVEVLLNADYPCFMTEFSARDWGGGYDGIGQELTSELERLKVSWTTFQHIPPTGVAPDVSKSESYKDLVELAGLSWTPDYGTWPAYREPYGNNGQPPETTGLSGTLRIQAEDFDKGGEGIAYHDTSTANTGGLYRTSEGVDLGSASDTGGGYCVIATAPGEWIEYTIWVTEPGLYDLSLRHAGSASATLRISSYNEDRTGNWELPATGGAQTWLTATREIFLPFGRQKIRVDIESGTPNLNWIDLSPIVSGPLADGAYKILNRNSGQAAKADTANNLLTQSPYYASSSQHWNLVHRGAGQYSIGSAASSSRYWSTFYNGNGDSINLNAWGFDWSADRRFILHPLGTNLYTIQVVDSGPVAEVEGASTTSGADIQQWSYTGESHQEWGIVAPAAPGIPSGLTASGVDETHIDLDWDPVSGATAYRIQRAFRDSGVFTTIANNVTTTSYTDSNVMLGGVYRYIVSAISGALEGPPSAKTSASPLGVFPGMPTPTAAALYNINMAGRETESSSADVPNGTIIKAPSLTGGSDYWNNLKSPGSAFWNFSGPRSITNANGSGAITVDWTGESGDHLIRWNSDNYYGLYKAMFGDPGDPWDLTLTFSGLDSSATYDIYWYSTWPESENPLTNTVTVGSCVEPVKVITPERDNVNGASDYSLLEEDVNYCILTDVAPNASGLITIRSQGDNVSVAGIQVVKRPPSDVAEDPDEDGIATSDEGADDPDGDGLMNYIDSDSDNDGCSDSVENASGSNPYDAADYPSLDAVWVDFGWDSPPYIVKAGTPENPLNTLSEALRILEPGGTIWAMGTTKDWSDYRGVITKAMSLNVPSGKAPVRIGVNSGAKSTETGYEGLFTLWIKSLASALDSTSVVYMP